MEKITTTPNTRMFQFIAAGAGCGVVGKKVITNASMRNKTENMFKGSPKRPRENLEGSSTSPRRRFNVIQEIETIYEEIRAPVPSDVMMLKATVDPMLINERSTAMAYEIRTELRGISQPGRTLRVVSLYTA